MPGLLGLDGPAVRQILAEIIESSAENCSNQGIKNQWQLEAEAISEHHSLGQSCFQLFPYSKFSALRCGTESRGGLRLFFGERPASRIL
jgi:hypothetical protein